MKSLYVIPFLFLIGCGHATTKMDRELALKLADKTPVVVQSAPPVINVNNFNGGQSQAPAYQPSSTDHESVDLQTVAEMGELQQNCTMSPVYTSNGVLVRYQRRCFGSK